MLNRISDDIHDLPQVEPLDRFTHFFPEPQYFMRLLSILNKMGAHSLIDQNYCSFRRESSNLWKQPA